MSRPVSIRRDIRVGFYGKLPSRGDFVRGGAFLRAVTAPWDQWLQSVMPGAQAKLGGRWTEVWHAAPAWRFALAPGVCGPQPVTGVWLPSVDSVGRTFPLVVAVQAVATDDALLAAMECAGADAIRNVMTPDMLSRRLSCAPCPAVEARAPGGMAIRTATRWWRRTGKEADEALRGDALPDADTFIRMLTP